MNVQILYFIVGLTAGVSIYLLKNGEPVDFTSVFNGSDWTSYQSYQADACTQVGSVNSTAHT